MKPAGTRLRDIRQARDLSLRELERDTGINRGIWSQIENGQLLPQARHLAALSEALGVPPDEWEIRFVLERKAS